MTLLADDFGQPNGLCFSLDEQHLFVNDTERKHIRVFDMNPTARWPMAEYGRRPRARSQARPTA